MTHDLRQRVRDGATVFGTFVVLGAPSVAEICARSGLDWVLIDLEHGVAGEADLMPMLMAIDGTDAAPIVRVEAASRIRVGRALDLGATGIMVPQVHSSTDAHDVASWLRTQPGGQRGVALFTRGMGYGVEGHAGAASAHEHILGIVQIESRAALDDVEAMAAVEGVDVLFVGPTDLSHALGIPGRIDEPLFEDAVERVAAAARSAGKACGVMVWQPDDVTRYARMGYTFFAISSDGGLLDRALRTALAASREATAFARAS